MTVDVDGISFETEGYEEGYTTGEPIAAVVLSTSPKSGDYTQFAGPLGEVRPGHTDLVKFHKSAGFVDVRGGGRSSYRSTISDVITLIDPIPAHTTYVPGSLTYHTGNAAYEEGTETILWAGILPAFVSYKVAGYDWGDSNGRGTVPGSPKRNSRRSGISCAHGAAP